MFHLDPAITITIRKQRIKDGNKFEYIDNVQMESSLKMKVVPTNVGCKTECCCRRLTAGSDHKKIHMLNGH